MKKSNNWIWWAFGGVTLIGVGIGTYLYIRNKNKEDNPPKATEPPKPPTTNSGGGSGSSPISANPFKDANEVTAFQSWVKNVKPNSSVFVPQRNKNVKGSEITTDGKYGPITDAFYKAHFKEYINAIQAQNTPDLTNGWNIIKGQMLDKNVWGNNSKVNMESDSRLRFAIDVDGSTDVFVNFIPSGYFWVEIGGGFNKFGGTWSFKNNVFTLKLDDGSWNMSDNEVSEMIKQILKMKYPSQMKYYQFTENKSDLENVLNVSDKNYVDSQDSML